MQGKIVVILGPTASGKTDLSIKLAKKYNGQVISADSRQVYKGMDVGTAKISKKEMSGIPHYLLDVASPKRRFTVAQYQKLAKKAIKNIQQKNKIPFLVGGTGFYIQSIVDGIVIPEVKPNFKLRKKLEKLSADELFEKLKKLDPKRAKTIDAKNPRRLIRALEIVLTTGRPVAKMSDIAERCRTSRDFRVLQIGIKKSPEELKKAIKKRLLRRLEKNALINEVKKLRSGGLSWNRLEEFGLEYRFVAQYLQAKISYHEMTDKILTETWHFAKRQMTWFSAHGGSASGGNRIHWVENYSEADKLIHQFLK